jgi:hypothetical protein
MIFLKINPAKAVWAGNSTILKENDRFRPDVADRAFLRISQGLEFFTEIYTFPGPDKLFFA